MNEHPNNIKSAYLAKLEEESSDAIFSRDLNHVIVSWNKGAEKIFGFSKEEAIGKKTFEVGFLNINISQIQAIENVLLSNGSLESEQNYKHKDGHVIVAAVTANIIRNEQEEIVSYLFVIKDITRLKQLENDLKEANEALEAKVALRTGELKAASELYMNIFENGPLPMWIFDIASYKFLDVNELATKEYGYSKEEFLTMTIMDIRTAEEKKVLTQFNLKNNTENFNQGIWKHQIKDGSIIDVEIVAHPLTYKGQDAKLVLANNVTKRLATEKKIEANEKRFRALIENSNEAIALLDENYTVFYRSPSTYKLTGWTDEEMIGQSTLKHVHPDDIQIIRNIATDILTNPGKIFRVTVRNKHKDGNYRWIEGDVINLLHDEAVRGVVYNFRDITEKKEAEEKVRMSENQLRYSLDNMIEGVQIIDFNWRYTYVNDSLVKDSKYTREELIGYKMMEKYPGIENTAMFAELKRCMEGREKGFFENEFTFPDGTKEYFELSIQPIPEGIFILSLNITDRVKSHEQIIASELRFRSLLENGNDIVSMFDKNFQFTYRSPSAFNVMGWPDTDMLGEVGTRNIHPEDLEMAKSQIEYVLKNPAEAIDVSLRMRHQKGHYLWIEGKLVNLLNNKNINAIIFNFRDVTDRKNAIDKLYASENKYRSIVERISDGFVTLDNDLKFTYLNKVAEDLFNTNSENLIGKKMYDEYSNGIGGDIYYAIHTALKTKKSQRIDAYSDVFKKWITGSIYPSETGLTCFFKDNTEIKKIQFELEEQQHLEQTKLISATIEAQEKERNAIGIELHDNVNQILVGTTMFLSMLLKKKEKDDALLIECIDNLKLAINENRKIAHILVAPDLSNKHIGEQISSLCSSMLHPNNIETVIDFDNFNYKIISKDQKVALYRIAQEQFTNIVKYSEATLVNITLDSSNINIIKMCISDNGKGMNKNTISNGIGLRNIDSRLHVLDGKMRIITAPGKGFSLEIEMPINVVA